MNSHADPVALLQQRLKLVAKLSGVNAEALKANQRIGGLQMDLQRLETTDGAAGADERAMVERDLAGAEAELAGCLERIAALEGEVAELDRCLAARR